MTMALNHAIVPDHGKVAAAQWVAKIFRPDHEGPHGPFAAVHMSGTLTLFDNQKSFETAITPFM